MSSVTINGEAHALADDADALLVDVLRDGIGLTGTKLVCGAGVCGACTVLLDGKPVASCLLPARAARGKSVVTVEGIGASGLHPVQKAFIACDGLQCGFCTPGFIVEAAHFHDAWRRARGTEAPSRDVIVAALAGHLCRCGAYAGIIRAVGDACAGRCDGAVAPAPRREAGEKVTGRAKYTVDIKHPGQLEGAILRSPHAHARVLELELGAARALPGVAACVSLLGPDKTLRYAGQEIAAVAASDGKTARAALAAIEVRYEPLPAAIGMSAARLADAPVVFSGLRKNPANIAEGPLLPSFWKRNLRGPSAALSDKPRKARRMLEAARTASDPLLVQATWRTDAQSHTAFEPHAAVARFDGQKLTLHASTQAAAQLAKSIAQRFALAPEGVRVIADHVGGGFGAKVGLRPETIAAVELARVAKAPVRVVLDRAEELSVTGYRPGCELALGLLAGGDGALKALSITALADTGAGVNSTVAALARLIYPAEAKELVDYDVVSNLPPGAPFRGPGGPVLCFALEQAVDEAAARLGIDPVALRRRWDPDVHRQRLYAWAADLDTWRRRAASGSERGRFRRGIGVAAAHWLYFWQPGCAVELSVKDGRLIASTAVQDIGQGIRSVLAETVARAFRLAPQDVAVLIGDSSLPEGPLSGGSRTTATVVPAAMVAADRLQAELRRQSNQPLGDRPDWRAVIAAAPDTTVRALRPADSDKVAAGVLSPLQQAGMMGAVFKWILRRFAHVETGLGAPGAVHVAEVEVDTLLGRTRVLRGHSGLAVGRVAAPLLARSQAEGSIIQGVGYALYEHRQVDPASGQVLTAGLEDYRIPGIADTPEIDIHFDEAGFEHVLGGGVGLGEIATLPVAAAIANAVHNATGARPYELPIRPDRLLASLSAARRP
jgi:CO/xanthine dehydrogenase Mo-binding subunit/aerobic-type carbon monoxide dehydrogenase small subunit (CoxS/CutS family)